MANTMEQKAIAHVMEYEKKQNRKPEDVSGKKRG
jgi:hypothetical protein